MSTKNIYWFEVKRDWGAERGTIEATTGERHISLIWACREVQSTAPIPGTTLLVSLHQAELDKWGDSTGPSKIIADFYPTEFSGGLPPAELNAALSQITHP